MLRGVDSLKNGMMGILEYHDNIANNLANINTNGYKQTIMTFKDIHDVAIQGSKKSGAFDEPSSSIGSLSLGSKADSVIIDFSQGLLKETSNPLDVAIQGQGFLKVKNPDGQEVFTRNGNLKVQDDKTITTFDNKPVITDKGVLKLQTNEPIKDVDIKKLVVMKDGNIYYKDKNVGKIDIYDFNDKINMKSVGDASYVPTDIKKNPAIKAKNFTLEQGCLEASNGNTITTMINSITAQRSYETMNNIMQTNSKTLEKTIGQVGRVVS